MRSDLLVPGLFAALAAAFPTPAGEAQNATCHDIQILIAVGHGENYPGTQQSIAQKICSGRSSCATSNIAYPSTASGSYCSAIQQGIASGQSLLKSIAASCPQTKIVILGWSQVRCPLAPYRLRPHTSMPCLGSCSTQDQLEASDVYLQGAQVAGDLIAGGGGKAQGPVAGGCTQATSTAIDPTTSPGNQSTSDVSFILLLLLL